MFIEHLVGIGYDKVPSPEFIIQIREGDYKSTGKVKKEK